jgi:hypothetical protein
VLFDTLSKAYNKICSALIIDVELKD